MTKDEDAYLDEDFGEGSLPIYDQNAKVSFASADRWVRLGTYAKEKGIEHHVLLQQAPKEEEINRLKFELARPSLRKDAELETAIRREKKAAEAEGRAPNPPPEKPDVRREEGPDPFEVNRP